MANAIEVKNLNLNYVTAKNQSIRSMRFFAGKKNNKKVHALQDVSFAVQKGEILGIIGTNGSGKSTLLKVLSGVLCPDPGSIELGDNSISLLSLGVGFNQELSGHDNIYLSGLLTGFTEKEIEAHYDEIIRFAELEDAIYRPVKTYSSGMYSKLAFSIAVTLKTDILLIDEVLSVGDIRFRQKSHAKMETLIQDKNRTVIIVSHNMAEIEQLCDRVMWLEKGQMRMIGPTGEVLKEYREELGSNPNQVNKLETPIVKVTPGEDSVHISWQQVPDALDYRIFRKESTFESRWKAIQSGYWRTEYTDTPPDLNREYLYTVRARTQTPGGNLWSDFEASDPVKLK